MNNIVFLPILLPLIVGVVLLFFANNLKVQRVISGITMFTLLGLSLYLTHIVYYGGIHTLELGNWRAPFGIVLVADNFAALMVLLTSIVGIVCLFFGYQTLSEQRQKGYFFPFYFFLITGVNGAFLTGDIFNLFVFFEVMLISSYILIVHGGTKYQLRESIKYVIINVFASGLFIVAIAYIYAVTGTLNMADISVKVAELEQQGVLNVIAILFLLVFGMKGALFPLYFWLPKSYYGPPAAIAALFGGLLTKVGIYAIIRTFTLIFYHESSFTHTIIMVIAGATMFFGVLGAVSQFDFKRILSFHIISQVGYMVMGLAIFTPLALAGAIYHIAHNIFVKSALFLYAGATQKVTGTTDLKKMGGLLKTHPFLGWTFFISAMAMAGIPPLSGFFSKFALVLSGIQEQQYYIVFVALFVGILTLFSMMKIFIYAFWGEQKLTDEEAKERKIGKEVVSILPLVALAIIMGLAAEPVFSYLLQVAEEILEPSIYINSVLKE
ncbi:Na+/H+ antiporter subunit D [Anaerobacillus alkalidiazotrophicus]|uniref:Na+/H+ antiporter subunit D n=1 Tax=Anaerobacillus alkalidiazotrophicus TaxID=472963 RepID=A0A1S2MBE8_9BACI|nr:Na+/H+ antiporter subunit D [Anaerobacillus alkalidiazotrophicus]OIJ22092.1 Na+/H+ antiporter subunit D [Anaerobacillus alkalidiazotrophicus]